MLLIQRGWFFLKSLYRSTTSKGWDAGSYVRIVLRRRSERVRRVHNGHCYNFSLGRGHGKSIRFTIFILTECTHHIRRQSFTEESALRLRLFGEKKDVSWTFKELDRQRERYVERNIVCESICFISARTKDHFNEIFRETRIRIAMYAQRSSRGSIEVHKWQEKRKL